MHVADNAQAIEIITSTLAEAGRRAHNETELRMAFEPDLSGLIAEAGWDVRSSPGCEKALLRGRADTVSGRVVLEFKAPGRVGLPPAPLLKAMLRRAESLRVLGDCGRVSCCANAAKGARCAPPSRTTPARVAHGEQRLASGHCPADGEVLAARPRMNYRSWHGPAVLVRYSWRFA